VIIGKPPVLTFEELTLSTTGITKVGPFTGELVWMGLGVEVMVDE